ncbi:MAG TPA: ABC transporter ATP-binding protein [Pseudolysinimonas sp.]|nr:ABC transporter ATP-binding protein [Pseudolysinimonas sp.]
MNPTASLDQQPLLDIANLTVTFPSEHGPVRAVRGVNLRLRGGESLAILGESGSGKSVTGKAALGLIGSRVRLTGSIRFEGDEIVGADENRLRALRGRGIAMVFQDSLDSLNPVYTVGSQLEEILRVRMGRSRSDARREAIALLEQVGITSPETRLHHYPHQFSGGMRQRVCIAMAIALRPRVLIADEPTTALDVTVQAGILRLLKRLQRETGMALIFVTHDLNVARLVADRVAVMYAGRVVETGPIDEVYRRPAHPYSRALMHSHPSAATSWSELHPIPGNGPSKSVVVAGCSFHPRCPVATERCASEDPPMLAVEPGRSSACHYAEEVLRGER